VEDIAERAGFTRGAFYSNFEHKSDLFLALLDDRLEGERGPWRRRWAVRTGRAPSSISCAWVEAGAPRPGSGPCC
jgi:AcrR family transcriptional regulator